MHPEQWIALGEEPKFNPKLLTKEGREIYVPQAIPWEVKGSWDTVADHEVTLKYRRFSFNALVHVCPPLAIKPASAVLPVGYQGYPITVTGGSGSYALEIEDPKILQIRDGKIYTTVEGLTKVTARDSKIPHYTAQLTVLVSRVYFSEIDLKEREIPVRGRFVPTCVFYGKDKS